MWTYRHPYRRHELSLEYHKQRGKLALSRSLSTGQLLAFVGSGLSIAYGRRDWDELVASVVQYLIDECKPSSGSTSQALFDRLKLLHESDRREHKVQLLGVAEHYAELEGKAGDVRRKVAEDFGAKRSKTRANRQRTIKRNLKPPTGGCLIDKIRAEPLMRMIADLKIRRFLTLNYDVEIEREFRNFFRTTNTGFSGKKSDFDKLCGGKLKKADKLDDVVVFKDGLVRSVVSTCLTQNNSAELANFAYHNSRYEGQVVHLHGRYDKPDTLVLGTTDYHRTYVGKEPQRALFEEALSAVFNGNDVLFIGVGMKEADMLRPLRQVVSHDTKPDIVKRHFFSIKSETVSLDKSFLSKDDDEDKRAELKDRFRAEQLMRPLHLDGKDKGSVRDDFLADEKESLSLMNEYGIYLIPYGGQSFRTLKLASQVLEERRKQILNTPKEEREAKSFKIPKGTTAAIDAILDELKKMVFTKTHSASIPDTLLSETEVAVLQNLLSHYQKTTFSKAECMALEKNDVGKALGYLEGEIQSRAIDHFLVELAQYRERWWTDVRRPPRERSAEFRRTYIEVKGKRDDKIPNFARHRPEYISMPKSIKSKKIKAFRELQVLAEQANSEVSQRTNHMSARLDSRYRDKFDTNIAVARDEQLQGLRNFTAVPPRRIIHCSLERGGGKGTFLHFLQNQVKAGKDKPPRLVLDDIFQASSPLQDGRYHGSFLLHLSFSMEFASVIEAMKIFFEQAVAGVMLEHAGIVWRALDKRLSTTEAKHPSILWEIKNKLRDLLKKAAKGKLSQKDFKKNLNEELGLCWLNMTGAEGPGRNHRLEELRIRINAFTDIVNLIGNCNLRVLVVMSGIDKLCDANGVAYNPMFRAFFRLLTGAGAKYQSESDSTMPVDLILISGDPRTPIRYLCKEYKAVSLPNPPAEEDELSYTGYHNYRKIEGDRYLEIWHRLPRIDIGEFSESKKNKAPYWLKDLEGVEPLFEAVKTLSEKQRVGDPRKRSVSRLERRLAESVALNGWTAGAFATLVRAKLAVEDEKESAAKGLPGPLKFVKELDSAAARGGLQPMLRTITQAHDTAFRLNPRDTLFFENKDKRLLKHLNAERGPTWAELLLVVMRHLVLFPMPVEVRVLSGCPHVNAILERLCGKKETLQLSALCHMLLYLQNAHLVIGVSAKQSPKKNNGKRTLEQIIVGDGLRFTIQHQIREYFGKRMDLSVPDQGERNFFQVSIYCDQPKDLPSPRSDHYELVRDIMEQQITRTRDAVWCLAQLEKHRDETNFDHLSPANKMLLGTGLQRRVTFGTKKKGFDQSLSLFHAAPQRIRALYGMLRSGFSMATISRLPGSPPEDVPYDRFRGWLRGLSNAAIGIGEWGDALNHFTSTEFDGIKKELKKNLHASLPDGKEIKTSLTSPLYRDEIGWLYNERGLLAFVQGNLYDALALFEIALDVMHHRTESKRNDPALHAAVRRVQLNQAVAQIDFGKIEQARQTLSALVLPDDFSNHAGSQVSSMAEAYLALTHHLSGNLEIAETRYERIVKIAQERGIFRMAAIFSRHWADLLRREKRFDEARRRIELAIHTARQSEQRDILHLALLSRAKIDISDPKTDTEVAHSTIRICHDFAHNMGLPRLKSEALRMQAEAFLPHDSGTAGAAAAAAASIANLHGLRLLKLSALSVYGQSLQARAEIDGAKRIYHETRRDAERCDYQSLSGDVTELLNGV